MGYSFRLAARVLLYAPSHRQDRTYHGLCYTSRGSLAGTRNRNVRILQLKILFNIKKKNTRKCKQPAGAWSMFEIILDSLRGRAFAHGAMGRRIDPSWSGPIELFLVPASAPRLV